MFCWWDEIHTQISHKYEVRRILVAQSCGELAEFVRPEIRDSLILSIIQQLIEDSATIVREAAAHNLALLLPLFPNLDKYFKVSLINAQRTSWSRKLSSQICLKCKLYDRLEQMAPRMAEGLTSWSKKVHLSEIPIWYLPFCFHRLKSSCSSWYVILQEQLLMLQSKNSFLLW